MTVPNIFANQTGPIPLSQLDANFAALTSVAGNGVSLAAAGADGTGVTPCDSVLATVLAALPAGGMIIFDAGKTFKLGSVNMNGKACTIWADGAIINCTSASGGLLKTDHNNKLTVVGGQWIGAGTATPIVYLATASANTSVDMVVSRAKFSTASGYCVSLSGCRETLWAQCEFTSATGGGVYCTQANNPYFSQCVFIGQGAGYGFFADGQGSPNSSNPVLESCEIMGWGANVRISGCDDFNLIGCTIDYGASYNTIIGSQDSGRITGGFLGSNTATPALIFYSEGANGWGPDNCQKITVSGVNFTGHYTGGSTYDNVQMIGTFASPYTNAALYPQEIKFIGNHFQFWTRYGINFAVNSERLLILGNDFDPRLTFGVKPIYNSNASGGDSATLIAFNQFTTLSFNTVGSGFQFAQFFNNTGIADFATNIDHTTIQMQANGNTGVGGPGAFYWHWVNQTGAIVADRYGNPATVRLRRADTGYGTPSNVLSGEAAGTVAFDSYNGANLNYDSVGQVSVSMDGVHDGTHAPSRMSFSITPGGSGVAGLTDALDIDNSGNVIVDPSGNLAALNPGLIFHSTSPTTAVGIYAGTANPPTLTAANGSLYLSSVGGVFVRAGGAWTALTVP